MKVIPCFLFSHETGISGALGATEIVAFENLSCLERVISIACYILAIQFKVAVKTKYKFGL